MADQFPILISSTVATSIATCSCQLVSHKQLHSQLNMSFPSYLMQLAITIASQLATFGLCTYQLATVDITFVFQKCLAHAAIQNKIRSYLASYTQAEETAKGAGRHCSIHNFHMQSYMYPHKLECTPYKFLLIIISYIEHPNSQQLPNYISATKPTIYTQLHIMLLKFLIILSSNLHLVFSKLFPEMMPGNLTCILLQIKK